MVASDVYPEAMGFTKELLVKMQTAGGLPPCCYFSICPDVLCQQLNSNDLLNEMLTIWQSNTRFKIKYISLLDSRKLFLFWIFKKMLSAKPLIFLNLLTLGSPASTRPWTLTLSHSVSSSVRTCCVLWPHLLSTESPWCWREPGFGLTWPCSIAHTPVTS